MVAHWCFWKTSSFMRKDHACVAHPHDECGVPTGSYWLAWPPYIEANIERVVLMRRFSTAEAAMAFADKRWPLLNTSQEHL
jgi:hypothetical protein